MECIEQLYAKKLDSLDKMGKVVEWHKLPKMTQEIKNLNRFITSKLVNWVNNHKTSHKEKPRNRWIYWWFLPNALRRINVNSSQTLPKREERVAVSNLFYIVNIILILKTDKDITRK